MDMLYRAYSNPLDLMNLYINQGRFGKFVKGFVEAEYERRKEEADRDNEFKLWMIYVHSYSDKSFTEWKESALKNASGKRSRTSDGDLNDDGINAIISKLFPS